MKKPVSKTDVRARLQRETERFLNQGGRVQAIPQGISGREPGNSNPFVAHTLFCEPEVKRTPVPEVVAAIEARRKSLLKTSTPGKRPPTPRPHRKTIYDDFGEPVRRVWVDK